MVKQGPLLSWKIETWLPNCGVIHIHLGKVDHLRRLPVFFPLTSDVHMYQIRDETHGGVEAQLHVHQPTQREETVTIQSSREPWQTSGGSRRWHSS